MELEILEYLLPILTALRLPFSDPEPELRHLYTMTDTT